MGGLVSETHRQTHKHRDRGTDIIIITSYYDVKMAPVHGDWMLSEMCASLYDSSVFFVRMLTAPCLIPCASIFYLTRGNTDIYRLKDILTEAKSAQCVCR